ncbi:hypothetical protein VTK26DRAFT_2249 [Humicola hyalothermophila]
MAPVNTDLQATQESIKNVIQDLFQILAQIANYDSAGRPSREALAQDLQTLTASLYHVHQTASSLPAHAVPGVPEPLMQYVENGRNPDIYTREFVELVRRMNQLARGKARAFAGFRDVLAREMAAALPELREDVRRVVEATGGDGGSGDGGGAGGGGGEGVGGGEDAGVGNGEGAITAAGGDGDVVMGTGAQQAGQ